MKQILQILKTHGVLIAYFFAALFVVIRNYFLPWGDLFGVGGNYSHYNNYLIFKQSFIHLVQQTNLYQLYPLEHYDFYKYPPIFALFMGPFYVLPDFGGYLIWTLLNLFVPIYAIKQMGLLISNRNQLLLLAILPEAITAALNSQSNGLVVGLLLLSIDALIRERTFSAVLFISLSGFIKIFGFLFFLIFLLFPNQFKKGVVFSFFICLILVITPAIFGGMKTLFWQYENWIFLLKNDHQAFVKYSVMGWLQSWFHVFPSKNLILVLGLAIQILPLLLNWKNRQNRSFLVAYSSSLIVWMVIFNHMAESATFIISVLGVFYFLAAKDTLGFVELFLGLIVFAFTILGPTDIYPVEIREWIVKDLQLKVFPCIAIWFYMLYDSLIIKHS